MNILFDARHIEDIYSGLARYTYSLLNALIENENYSKLTIIFSESQCKTNNPLFKIIKGKLNNKTDTVFLDAPLFKFKHHYKISTYVNSSNCDLYFYPHFDLPLGIKKKSIFVVHDLLPLVVDNYIIKHKFLKQLYFRGMIRRNLKKKNTTCIAVSQSTKNDILTHIDKTKEQKIKVVYESSFDVSIGSDEKNQHISLFLDKKFLLYIGTRRPHKNLKKMIDAFEVLRTQFSYDGDFIIAGSTKNYDFDLDEYIKNRDGVFAIGTVSDEELIALYKKMDALFFLTRYEGFGLPIIEAAELNQKIVTSNTSSCIEIAPPTALILDPDQDKTLIAELVCKYIADNTRINNSEYLNRFSWKKTAANIFASSSEEDR